MNLSDVAEFEELSKLEFTHPTDPAGISASLDSPKPNVGDLRGPIPNGIHPSSLLMSA